MIPILYLLGMILAAYVLSCIAKPEGHGARINRLIKEQDEKLKRE